jgi:hypothetical protein
MVSTPASHLGEIVGSNLGLETSHPYWLFGWGGCYSTSIQANARTIPWIKMTPLPFPIHYSLILISFNAVSVESIITYPKNK